MAQCVRALHVVCGSHDVYYDVNSANPPLSFDLQRASSSDYIVFQLQTTASKLRNAFHGVDVSWIDSGSYESLARL